MTDSLQVETPGIHMHRERSCEDTVKKQPPGNQRERTQKKSNLDLGLLVFKL